MTVMVVTVMTLLNTNDKDLSKTTKQKDRLLIQVTIFLGEGRFDSQIHCVSKYLKGNVISSSFSFVSLPLHVCSFYFEFVFGGEMVEKEVIYNIIPRHFQWGNTLAFFSEVSLCLSHGFTFSVLNCQRGQKYRNNLQQLGLMLGASVWCITFGTCCLRV